MKKRVAPFVIYILILTGAVVLNFLTASYGMFVVLVIALLCSVISFTYSWYLASNIVLELESDKDMTIRGDVANVKVKVHNNSFLKADGLVVVIGYSYNNLDKRYQEKVKADADGRSHATVE